MDIHRALLAVVLSFVILIGYQYLFIDREAGKVEPAAPAATPETSPGAPVASPPAAQTMGTAPMAAPQLLNPVAPGDRVAREIEVDTELYRAVISENGGVVKSFVLKQYRETLAQDSPGVQLIKTTDREGFPLSFSWGGVVAANTFYEAKEDAIVFSDDGTEGVLSMRGLTPSGLELERTYRFDPRGYLLKLELRVKNTSANPLQGSPMLNQVNLPFEADSNGSMMQLFTGPAVFMDHQRKEFGGKELVEPKTVQGKIEWAAYDSTYFMCAILPEGTDGAGVTMQEKDRLVSMQVAGGLDVLQPGEEKVYAYHLFYGPKKLSLLQGIGYNLDKAVDFGWFDIMAKPTLWLLNFFHAYVRNYGVAIILVTIVFKVVFWPITQKGLKSMKNMQKLQPKMVKLKEKYKNDPATMNKEVMNLYRTYKVNPLGGCLPMLLQIPVFFALYKVLLMCIELRHAPFMLWINDLSVPDRLMIGVDIPYLGGIPVLTLLMGASMFLQQKMTPTTADPTQARIMLFLPVIFTFMFLNFASGLVLYWFVNNLLAILQQYLINRQANTPLSA